MHTVCLWWTGKSLMQRPMDNSDMCKCNFPDLGLPCHQDFIQKWQKPCFFAAFCGSVVSLFQQMLREMLLFPILKTKGSLIDLFLRTNWGFVPFGKCSWKILLSRTEVPVVGASGERCFSTENHSTSEPVHSPLAAEEALLVNSVDLLPFFFLCLWRSFILKFNEQNILCKCPSVVSHNCLFFFKCIL